MSTNTLSPQNKQVLDELIFRVGRAFHEPKHVVALDLIGQLRQVRDDDLASVLKLSKAETHKICGKLSEDKLINEYSDKEAMNPGQRKTTPVVLYYLDYKSFVDLVKFKIHKIDQHLNMNAAVSDAYSCPSCGSTFTQVDVAHSFDNTKAGFTCPADGFLLDPLVTNEREHAEEMRRRWSANKKPIVELLKLCDSIVIEQRTATIASRNVAALAFDSVLECAERVTFQVVIENDVEQAGAGISKPKRGNEPVPWFIKSCITGDPIATTRDRHEEFLEYNVKDGAFTMSTGREAEIDDYIINYYKDKISDIEEPCDEFALSQDKVQAMGMDISYPSVAVAADMVPLLEVTDEHRERMTPEEYQIYYDVCQEYM